jgi:hypothetical protein
MQKITKADFEVQFVEDLPDHVSIHTGTIMIVGGKDWAKWILFKCPCGCGDVLTLSLMKSYKPRWRLRVDKLNLVTLSPSVWKKDGCKSHFYIRKSNVKWVYW